MPSYYKSLFAIVKKTCRLIFSYDTWIANNIEKAPITGGG